MKKCLIVYTSSTGNTEQMAKTIADEVRASGAEAVLCQASAVMADQAETATHFALGCSAHGVEELDAVEFIPALEQIEGFLRGKPVLLFGSYGWGGGAFMKPWEERIRLVGGQLAGEGFVFEGSPMEEASEEGRKKARELMSN